MRNNCAKSVTIITRVASVRPTTRLEMEINGRAKHTILSVCLLSACEMESKCTQQQQPWNSHQEKWDLTTIEHEILLDTSHTNTTTTQNPSRQVWSAFASATLLPISNTWKMLNIEWTIEHWNTRKLTKSEAWHCWELKRYFWIVNERSCYSKAFLQPRFRDQLLTCVFN